MKRLISILFGPFFSIEHGFALFFGSDPAPAPDYTPIAAANAESAKYAKDAAEADLAFRKQEYSDNQPYVKKMQDTASTVADAQIGAMEDSNARATDQWDSYTNTFKPIEEKVASEAMTAGGDADQERAAGSAVADVQQQSALAHEASARRLESMGVNPNSGNFVATANADGLRTAAVSAGAANSAKVAQRDKGISLRAGAASFGRNQTNTAGQMVGIGTNSGNSSAGAAGAGANAYLPGATFVAGGYDTAQKAAGIQQQGALGLGGLMNQGYGISSNAQAQSDAGFGSMIGGLGMLGAKYAMSSKTLKHDMEPIKGEYALESVERLPIEKWTYNAGVADEGTHIGAYAEDVQQELGDKAAPGGKKVDLVSLVGLNMAATQELSKQIKSLKAGGIRRG